MEEVLGFETQGDGEHVLVRVEKRGANTQWVAKELARMAGIPPRDVSFAGRKDRQAVAVQHFSLWLGKRPEPDWSTQTHPEFRVLAAARHRRKLRIGALRGNRFRLLLRDLTVPAAALESRLAQIRQRGVPNYFGPQRFGRDGANIARAAAFFSGELSIRKRNLRSLLLSTARSLIFNAVVSQRVADNTWDKILPGEVCMLDGSHSVFHADSVDAALAARSAAGDVHPTGPSLVGQRRYPRLRECSDAGNPGGTRLCCICPRPGGGGAGVRAPCTALARDGSAVAVTGRTRTGAGIFSAGGRLYHGGAAGTGG